MQTTDFSGLIES